MERGEGWTREGIISSGCPEFDAALPDGGYRPGTIVEWLEATPGSGGFYLAMSAARHAMGETRYLVVVDPRARFYPPAAQAMGIPLERLVVLRPRSESDGMWSIDQALRCPAIGSVVAHLDHLSDLQARRFQLAAEQGQGLGCWLRPRQVQRLPSWSEIQWLVQPVAGALPSHRGRCVRRLGLQSLRMRGATVGQRWNLEIDTLSGRIALERSDAATSSLHLAAQLAMPKNEIATRRRTGQTPLRITSA
jgi:hypothetical protein